ncbi:hypothetical protein [Bacillus marasmi]|uniref:hypothetical protein n=1 Tax=Bacillus marasmi TaxID=1926279 RepID=UPI0011C753EF|nr:hypothetical protein [Bacillus marasmi]
MTETLKIIETSALPIQLKEYFRGSRRIQKLITAEIIEDIEDLFLYYDSLYHFDLSKFGVCTIDSLIKCKDFSSYYFYLKKILENHLDVELKDDNNSVRIKKDIINDEFEKSAFETFKLIPIESHEQLTQLNFYLGKLELINKLIVDENYISIYDKILQLLDNYNTMKKATNKMDN